MSRTTPPRPLDVTAAFPQLAPLARTATRLHPRPGTPSLHESSVGGPLLWPADEPWPYCEGPHEWDQINEALAPDDIRLQRRIWAADAARPSLDPWAPPYTIEEWMRYKRITGGPWPEGPIPLLPVAQLYVRDVPLLCPPGSSQADLLQVLWCPFDHLGQPKTALFWRSSTDVTKLLAAPPEPPVIQFPGYLPEPCLLAPEQITEYPNLMELSYELQQRMGDWDTWQTAGAVLDSSYEPAPQEFYWNDLSLAPGWKVGGWTRWGLTDPIPRSCPACGTPMNPLLTIASSEWSTNTHSWIPYEDQDRPRPRLPAPQPSKPTMLDLARGYDLQLHVCPVSPEHPHTELIQ